MKAYAVHYKNKYPKALVEFSDEKLDVYAQDGDHLLALRKNGAGQVVDMSEEFGLAERHDLSPIPKDSRCWKLSADGKIVKDEKHEERSKAREAYMSGEKVLSCLELEKAKGMKFDDKQVRLEK